MSLPSTKPNGIPVPVEQLQELDVHRSTPELEACPSTAPNEKSFQAPDGGFGWVVVVSSFFLHAITSGTAFSFGTLYVELLYIFQGSHSLTALVGSLQNGFMLIPGNIIYSVSVETSESQNDMSNTTLCIVSIN